MNFVDSMNLMLSGKRKALEDQRSKHSSKYIKRKHLNNSEKIALPEVTAEPAEALEIQIQTKEAEQIVPISNEEAIRRLRAFQEPIRYFGESDFKRYQRLMKLESAEERSGLKNDFLSAQLETDERTAVEFLYRNMNDDGIDEETGENSRHKVSNKKVESAVNNDNVDTSIISAKLLKDDVDKTRFLITVFVKRRTLFSMFNILVIKEWGEFLDARSYEEKQSAQGKFQATIQKQTSEFLKPFFKNLKKKLIPMDVLTRINEICMFINEREYQKANDSYLRLSIGNAAWPIGVTMVGIHERSGRERINSSQVGHVLNDETQRKWIQSIKRLMTFAQTIRPPADLSKLVG